MTVGQFFERSTNRRGRNNSRHRFILQSFNMNAIPNNIPNNMIPAYMSSLDYGSIYHSLPKNLAKKLMYYYTPHDIYRRARETQLTKNTHPNLSYNDALVLSHFGPYINQRAKVREVINSYKSLKRRGMSSENAAWLLTQDPLLGKKHNASNTIKRAWKTFRYGTMLRANRTPKNPKFRVKMERYSRSANKSYDKYAKLIGLGLGGSPKRRSQMSSLKTELLRKKRPTN